MEILPQVQENPKTPQLGYMSTNKKASPAGAFLWAIDWRLDKATKKGGFIVQHVNVFSYAYDAKGNKVKSPYPPLDYWEAFEVNVGSDTASKHGTIPLAVAQAHPNMLNETGQDWFVQKSVNPALQIDAFFVAQAYYLDGMTEGNLKTKFGFHVDTARPGPGSLLAAWPVEDKKTATNLEFLKSMMSNVGKDTDRCINNVKLFEP